jgi:hypothetical protein
MEISYALAKEQSAKKDFELGFRIDEVEAKLKMTSPGNYWIGLAPDVLQTPYSEFSFILKELNLAANSLVVDVGAAYGRLAHVIGKDFPRLKFLGFEAVKERVEEGNRVLSKFKYQNVELICADVTDETFTLPAAAAYFIYDFGSTEHVRKVLFDLGEISKSCEIKVVGRGRLSRDLIERENPWLSQVVSPQHFKNFSIYRTQLVLEN